MHYRYVIVWIDESWVDGKAFNGLQWVDMMTTGEEIMSPQDPHVGGLMQNEGE